MSNKQPPTNRQKTLSYRAEIDGLRAVAVLSVILYHAQLIISGRNWFAGGYIGVDVFFVISGYLISRIIIAEIVTNNHFNFLNFYHRRARRILPMLFLTILLSTPFAWYRLLPGYFVEYAKSALSSVFFSSNFFFYLESTEYAAGDSLLKPLLHTWSLGVEEQFYIFFPLLILLLYRFCKPYLSLILFVLCLFSLGFAQIMTANNAELNFYLPFSRFWELAAGSMLAIKELRGYAPTKPFYNQLLPLLGLLLILISIFSFDETTAHPGFYTMIPIIGTALIIRFASDRDLTGKLLNSKLFVGLGLISYSAYLWHFPIFAFLRNGSEDLTNLEKTTCIIATILLSIVSFFVIERPFRNKVLMSNRKTLLFLGLGLITITVFMTYVIHSKGVWNRYTKAQQELIKVYNTREFRALTHPLGEQGLKLIDNKKSAECFMRDPNQACRVGKEKVVFLGDSYVGHYERAVIDELKNLHLGFISFSYESCPFVSPIMWFRNKAECSYVNEQRRKIIAKFTDKKIFIISSNNNLFFRPKKRTDNPIADGRTRTRQGEALDSRIAWDSYFNNIRWLEQQGHKIILLRSIPNNKLDTANWLGQNAQYLHNMDFPDLFNHSIPSKIKSIDNRRYPNFNSQNILTLDPVDFLCDQQSDRCYDVKKNIGPIYNGGKHLSYPAASMVAKAIKQSILEQGWDRQL